MPRRALVVLVLASLSLAPALGGCRSREGKLKESQRLTEEGTRLRMEGLQTGNEKRLEKGQRMIDKGKRMRESALGGM